jgi:hypothetical protein
LQLVSLDEGVVLVTVDDGSCDVRAGTYGMNIGSIGAGPDPGEGTKRSQAAKRVVGLASFRVDVGSVVVDIPLTACRLWRVPGSSAD